MTGSRAHRIDIYKVARECNVRLMDDGEVIFAARSAVDGISPVKQAKFEEASRKLFVGGGRVVAVERRSA